MRRWTRAALVKNKNGIRRNKDFIHGDHRKQYMLPALIRRFVVLENKRGEYFTYADLDYIGFSDTPGRHESGSVWLIHDSVDDKGRPIPTTYHVGDLTPVHFIVRKITLYPDESQAIRVPGKDPTVPFAIVDTRDSVFPYERDARKVPVDVAHPTTGIHLC